MERGDAYAVLSQVLNQCRRSPYEDLVQLANSPPTITSMIVGHETVEIEVCVRWATAARQSLRIDATAYGPSCWRLERLEETITISPDGVRLGAESKIEDPK